MKITKRVVLGLLVGLSFASCKKENNKSISDTWELTVNGDQSGTALVNESISLSYNFEEVVFFGDQEFKSFSWTCAIDGQVPATEITECRVVKINSDYGNNYSLEIINNPVDYALTMEIHSYTKNHLILMVNPGEENERLWTFEKKSGSNLK